MARYADVTALRDDRHCLNCREICPGWIVYERVGPNLPQRSVNFRCDHCKSVSPKGVVYWYDGSRGVIDG